MKKEKRYWFAARRDAIDGLTASDIMDMLRYDSVRVEFNPPNGMYLMSKLKSSAREVGDYPPPTINRWASFGIRIHMIGVGPEAPAREEIIRVVESEERILEARQKKIDDKIGL